MKTTKQIAILLILITLFASGCVDSGTPDTQEEATAEQYTPPPAQAPKSMLTQGHAQEIAGILAENGFASNVVAGGSSMTIDLYDDELTWDEIEYLTNTFTAYTYNKAGTGDAVVYVFNNDVPVAVGYYGPDGEIEVDLENYTPPSSPAPTIPKSELFLDALHSAGYDIISFDTRTMNLKDEHEYGEKYVLVMNISSITHATQLLEMGVIALKYYPSSIYMVHAEKSEGNLQQDYYVTNNDVKQYDYGYRKVEDVEVYSLKKGSMRMAEFQRLFK